MWVDSVRGSGQEGWGVIDATVAREDGTYFRVYKDEGDMTLRLERSTDLLATVVGDLPAQGQEVAADEWALVSEQVCAGLPNGVEGATFLHGEGPSLFPANPGDASGARWYLFIDQPGYHEGPDHYVPFATAKPLALTRPEDWYSCAEGFAARMPCNADGGRPRHGTVVPVTAAERDHLLAALGPR